MSSATIIGRVAVKVYPDTSDFRSEAEHELTAAEKALRDVKVGVNFDVDLNELQTEVDAAAEKAEKAAKSIKIRLDLDNQDEVKRELKKVERELDKLKDRWEVKVGLNDSELNAMHDVLSERLRDIGTLDLKITEDRASLASALHQIEAEIRKMDEVDLSIALDRDSLEQAASELRASIKAMDNHVTLEYDASSIDSVRSQLQVIESEIQKLDMVQLDVELDRHSLEEARKRLKNIEDVHIHAEIDEDNKSFLALRAKVEAALAGVHVRADVSKADERKIKRELDDLFTKREALVAELKLDLSEREKHRVKRELDDIDAKVKVNINELSARRAQVRMSWLTRMRESEIYPRVNEAAAAKAAATLAALSGGRAFGNISRDFADFIGGLDKSIPKMATASLAVLNLGASTLSTTSNLLSLGSSLASIGGVSLALPGILGGLAIGVGTFAAAMHDFNKFFPKFAVSGSRTTSAGQAWQKLQDTISTNFWAKAEKPMGHLLNTLFPQFSRGVGKVATELGGFTGKLSKAFTGVFNKQLDSMFADLGKSIAIMGDHMGSFVGIIQKLGEVGAGNLPRLAGWFGNLFDKFDAWLGKKGPDGLQAFIDSGIQGLKDLGGVLKGTGRIFKYLADAAEAAGSTSLGTLNDKLNSIADTIAKPEFQTGLSQVFIAAHKAMDNLTNTSGKAFQNFLVTLGNTFETALPQAGQTLGTALKGIFDALGQDSIQTGLLTLLDHLDSAVNKLAPSLPGFADGLASVFNIVGKIADNLAGALSPVMAAFGPMMAKVERYVTPLVDALGTLLRDAVVALIPVLSNLIDILGGRLQIFVPLIKGITALGEAFGKLPSFVHTAMGALVAIGVTVGAAMWFGAAVRGKLTQFGLAVTNAGRQSVNASGQMTVVGRSMIGMGTATQAVTSRMTGMRAGLAGAGTAITFMGLAAAKANKPMAVLSGAAGGALAGLAGGPWGVAIGGTVGALTGLWSALSYGKDKFDEAKIKAGEYKDSLDEVTSATTEATRATVYDQLTKSGAIKTLGKYGVSARDAVDAVLGQADASAKVRSALAQENTLYQQSVQDLNALKNAKDAANTTSGAGYGSSQSNNTAEIQKQIDAQEKVVAGHKATIDAISRETGALDKQTAAQIARNQAVIDWDKRLKGLPPTVVSDIKATGVTDATAKVEELTRKYHLTPKKVQTLIDALNADTTVRKVQKATGAVKNFGKQHGKAEVTVEVTSATKNAEAIREKLKDITNSPATAKFTAKDDATKPIREVQKKVREYAKIKVSATISIKDNASAGLNAIKTKLDNLNGRHATVTTEYVTQYTTRGGGGKGQKAGATPRAAASKPSIADGVTGRALETAKKKAHAAGHAVAAKFQENFLDTMVSMRNKVAQEYGKVLGYAKKRGKKQVKKVTAEFKGALAAIARKAGDITALENALTTAEQKVADIQQAMLDFKQSIIDTFNAATNPVSLGAHTYQGILKGMQDVAAKATRFSKVMQDLIKAGLNPTTIQQLIAAGPVEGLQVAEQILQGGVTAINDAQKEIDTASASLGQVAPQAVFGNLLGQAQKEVADLKAQLAPLQQQLVTMIQTVFKAMQDEAKKQRAALDDIVQGNNKKNNAKKNGKNNPKKPAKPGKNNRNNVATAGNGGKTLNYYAAPNKSMSQEDFFAAASRARGGW